MNWSRFVTLARCPAIDSIGEQCAGRLEYDGSTISCSQCSKAYPTNATWGFPLFAAQSQEEKQHSKYEDPHQRLAERYVALWAFGYEFLRRGDAEGFYRTINELGFSTPLTRDGAHNILEVGCGVGRNVCDYARYYPNALVVGADFSERMLQQAFEVLIGREPGAAIEFDLRGEGFGLVSKPALSLQNVFLAQADALNLPFASAQFDIVLAPNLIDRLPDPDRFLAEASRVLKPGAYLVLADPFNWVDTPEWWNACTTVRNLERLIGGHSMHIEVAFDDLIYRELLDARGSYTEWRVAIVRAVKE